MTDHLNAAAKRVLSTFALALLLGGCGGNSPDGDSADLEGLGAAPSGGSTAGMIELRQMGGAAGAISDPSENVFLPEPSPPPPGYPAGPYGTGDPAVGDVIENLAWEGFSRIENGTLSSEGTFAPMTLASLREGGQRYALVHVATIWCPSCRSAADDLALRGDELSDKGALVIELVLEGNYGALPTEMELSNWIKGSDLTITTVRPADARTTVVFPSREHAYIIDLETMKVVWTQVALFSDPSITELSIDALLALL